MVSFTQLLAAFALGWLCGALVLWIAVTWLSPR
jgi:hypothetical protein